MTNGSPSMTTQPDRLRIGIDVDGCLYPWSRAVNEAVASRFDLDGLVDHTHWDYLREQLTDEQWHWVWSDNAVLPVFGRFDLIYPHAREVVNDLCKRHDVHFVTHRNPATTAAVTAQWIGHYFRGYKGIIVCDGSVSKATLAAWDAFIDDKPKTVHELRESGVPTLIPKRPWNEEFRGSRFASWLEVPELIAAIYEPMAA